MIADIYAAVCNAVLAYCDIFDTMKVITVQGWESRNILIQSQNSVITVMVMVLNVIVLVLVLMITVSLLILCLETKTTDGMYQESLLLPVG